MKKFLLMVAVSVLKFYASLVLYVKRPEIIAITGSSAKSSTKEAIFSLLYEKFGHAVGKSEGNLNTEIGVPLTILRFKKAIPPYFLLMVLIWAFFKAIFIILFVKYPKILVLEMAADKPDDIEYLISYVKPKVAVITAIGPAHLHTFKSIFNVAKEKTKLVEVLPKDGYAVLNQNDGLVKKMSLKTRAKIKFFIPKNNDIASEAAKMIGEIYQLSDQQIRRGLKKVTPLIGRMNLAAGKNGSLILFDAYNANPVSMSFALHRLSDLASRNNKKRKIAILGDMLELGKYAKIGHKEVAKVAKKEADLLLCVGDYGKIIAREGGGHFFETKKELIDFLINKINKNDIILIKASRKMKFEEIARALELEEDKK